MPWRGSLAATREISASIAGLNLRVGEGGEEGVGGLVREGGEGGGDFGVGGCEGGGGGGEVDVCGV